MKVAAAIPAKGHSSRVPSKNLKLLGGVPLFLWAANNLSKALPAKDIYIDSDSEKILALASKCGFSTIHRPESLASNATNGNELMLWEASQIECDIILQHLPPNPFFHYKKIKKAIDLIRNGMDSTFSLYKRNLYLWKDNQPTYSVEALPNSFELPQLGIEGMGFYATRKQILIEKKTRICGKFAPIHIESIETIDIDEESDFEHAETVARGLATDSVYRSGIERFKEFL